HDEHHHGRDQGSRQQVRRQHGKGHRFRQRNEKKLRYSGQKEHRHKNDANTQRRYQRRNRNLLGTVEDGLFHLLAHGQIAFDVFDLHRRIIHQDADSERQSSQGHDVDGLAERAQENHGDEDGQWDRDRDDYRRTPIAQEEKDHGGGKTGGDQAFPHDSRN